ncbi:MAG: hypothetical protein Pg6C_04230 [Treponemataceae bacterium]|jgi:hypothetical protein|nr:MAG: hypothetical protein Pg6C_04230 [Treponemataceae bacterium]
MAYSKPQVLAQNGAESMASKCGPSGCNGSCMAGSTVA